MNKILVVGCGFVGGAMADYLDDQYDIVRVDPVLYPDVDIYDHLDAIAAIVAVPTPSRPDGSCDDSILKQVITEITMAFATTFDPFPILVKSTVTPDLLNEYGTNVTYSPEFLRAKTAKEDMENMTSMVVGGTFEGCAFWQEIFAYKGVDVIETDRKTASMVKYMHNTWLAMKVAYFHEVLSNVGDQYDHDDMVSILSTMENIGPSHMNVVDGFGFGGHCFPKDTKAFLDFSNSDILKQVIDTNNRLTNLK